MTEKPWWASKTIWANVIALIAMVGSMFGLDLGLTPEIQAQILAVVMAGVNIVLRVLTKGPIK